MASYSVAEAKNRLPSLIRKAAEGEEVVITRHGKPIVELRATSVQPGPQRADASYEWLRKRRDLRPAVDVSSVQLLRDMHAETEW